MEILSFTQFAFLLARFINKIEWQMPILKIFYLRSEK